MILSGTSLLDELPMDLLIGAGSKPIATIHGSEGKSIMMPSSANSITSPRLHGLAPAAQGQGPAGPDLERGGRVMPDVGSVAPARNQGFWPQNGEARQAFLRSCAEAVFDLGTRACLLGAAGSALLLYLPGENTTINRGTLTATLVLSLAGVGIAAARQGMQAMRDCGIYQTPVRIHPAPGDLL